MEGCEQSYYISVPNKTMDFDFPENVLLKSWLFYLWFWEHFDGEEHTENFMPC